MRQDYIISVYALIRQTSSSAVATQLHKLGIATSDAKRYPEYAPDYWATFFSDPDGLCLEVTNYRQECRERHDKEKV